MQNYIVVELRRNRHLIAVFDVGKNVEVHVCFINEWHCATYCALQVLFYLLTYLL